jgi:tetratricopeptide (TPR) repeat protein
MALQPAARYAAPHELVEEVERWMADEPVAVYRERFGERLARWSRRHRVWIRAGAIALTTVTLVSLGAAWLILRAWNSEARARNDEARARGHAEQRLVQARAAVDKWLTGVSEALRYYPVTNKARQRLLEQAAEDYERFVQQGAGDVALEIERGRTYLRLGHVRLILRDAPSAEQAYGEARRLFEQLLAENPENRECQVELANSLTDLGLLAMDLGNTPRADEYYRTAQGQLEPLHKQFPKSIPVRLALGTVLVNRAELLRSTARPADADAALRQALALLGGLTDELSDRRDGVPVASPEDRSLDREDAQRIADEATLTAASARTLLGYVLSDQGRYADAVSEIRAAASLAARLVTRDPHDPRYLELLADCQNYLAVCLRTIGRSDEEEDAYRQAIEHYAALCQALPAVADFEERLAITRTNRGSLLHKLGRVKDAEAELNEAQTILDRLVSRNPDVARCRSYQACCRDTLGQLHRDRGQLSQAQAAFRDAIKSYEALAASDRESVEHAERLALCRSHLGQTLQLLGQHSEAEQEFAAAIAGLSKLPPESPRRRYELAMVHQHRGRLWAGQAKADQAVADFGTAKRILSELASAPGAAEHRAEFAWLLVNCPHTELREPQAALRLADALTAEVSGNAHYHFLVGAALYRLGEFTKAIAALRQASHLRGFEHARDGFFLAMAYGKAGDRDQAQAAYRRAQQWFAANLPADQDLQRIQREAAEVIGVKTPPN